MKAKHWIKIGIFTIIVALVLLCASIFLQVTSSQDTARIRAFYKEPNNSLDVILIGPSDIYSSFIPVKAYRDFGFTSYPLACGSIPGSMYSSIVRESEKTQHPKIYLVELWSFHYVDQHEEANMRRWIDSIPNSENRTQTIKENVPKEMRRTFYFPFLKYHSNFKHLKTCLQAFTDRMRIDKYGYSITKGFSTITSICKVPVLEKKYTISDEGLIELQGFLDFCKNEEIDNVVFLRTSQYYEYTDDENTVKAIQMIKDAGFDFIDLDCKHEEIGLDKTTDYYNNAHLNIFGAEKNTEYLGNYLKTHYLMDIEHSEEVTKEWNHCVSYLDGMLENVENQTKNETNRNLFMHKDLLK